MMEFAGEARRGVESHRHFCYGFSVGLGVLWRWLRLQIITLGSLLKSDHDTSPTTVLIYFNFRPLIWRICLNFLILLAVDTWVKPIWISRQANFGYFS